MIECMKHVSAGLPRVPRLSSLEVMLTPGSQRVLKRSCAVARRASQWPRTDKMQAGREKKRENCLRRQIKERISLIVLTRPKWELNNGCLEKENDSKGTSLSAKSAVTDWPAPWRGRERES